MTSNKETLSELTSLKARALKAYATKDFPQSADLYAQACTLQTEIHGEGNPSNAHLLYLYGRSLYKVAIQKSDVLGGAAPEEKERKPVEGSGSGKEKGKEKEETAEEEKKPAGLFQFTGDEAYDDDGDEDNEEAEGEDGYEEEDDEMILAWEVLDLARILFEKQLAPPTEEASTSSSTAPPTLSTQQVTDTKTMLSDVFDLLGEVSLESETFPQATKDFNSALALKHELYPLESTLISEAEFKMALALEFSAQDPDLSSEDAKKLRDAAAAHIEGSIDSCHARIKVEKAKISDNPDKDHAKETKEIENVKGMIVELEQRLQDLKNPPVEETQGNEELHGLLGQLLGGDQDPLLAKEALEKAMKGANDLNTLVRKKPSPAAAEVSDSKSKRKLEDVAEEAEVETSKKAKVEDGEEEA